MATTRKRPTAKKPARKSSVSTSNKKMTIGEVVKKINYKTLILPAILIIIIALIGFYRNFFVVANVNGEQISRIELINELEKSDGQRILETLVTQKLIEQEAKKQNITASDKEIDEEITKIEKTLSDQGQNLDDLLAIQNYTRKQLREQVKNQVILQKLVNADKIEVTDDEVNQYMEQNQGSFPEEADQDQIKSDVKEQLKQQKVNTEVQNLLTKLQSDSKINFYLGN